MPNLYATLGQLKAELGKTNTADDAVLLGLLDRGSREIDNLTNRHWWAETATRYFDGSGRPSLQIDDLISVTTLKVDDNRDDTYELTLAVTTDYWLSPDNPRQNTPYTRIDLNPNSTQLHVWPHRRRSVQLAGVFGYSAETEASGTLGAAIANTTTTTVTMTAGHGLTAGATIYVGTEQMYVSAVSTNTLTVVRGVNGTTAASASNSAPVTRRRFDRNVEQACIVRAADLWRGVQSGYSPAVASPEVGGFASATAWAQFRGLLNPVSRMVVV